MIIGGIEYECLLIPTAKLVDVDYRQCPEDHPQVKALIDDKKKIQYSGKTGIGAFNENNDPSSANIGIYAYDDKNVNVFQAMQSGEVPSE